jgi:GNAT superfamily N-acetyltransferase
VVVTDRVPSVELADDPALAGDLAPIVNRVYALSEGDLWESDKRRTDEAELRERIAAGEIAVAANGSRPLGCVRVREVEPGVAELGLLAVDPDHQGAGVGRALVDFAERHARDGGATRMRLELLVPRDGAHPHKDRLDAWYSRRGYRPIGTRPVETSAVPCEFVIYERPL